MEYTISAMQAFETQRRIKQTIGGAFLAAHLLTAKTEQAESAVVEAMESWDPDDDSEEVLFLQVLRSALQADVECVPSSSNDADSLNSMLPAELNAVLSLPPQLRHCFVVRMLVGFSREICARLLHLHSRQVDQYTRAALQRLPFLDGRSFESKYFVRKGSMN
jgi:DNA-directed RNA polymerase specialized sigma24 family protein